MSMLSSRDLPWTIPAAKPPAKASLQDKLVQVSYFSADVEYLPSTVSVGDGVLGDLAYSELLDLDLTIGLNRGCYSRQGTLGDNSNTRTAGVLLRELSKLLGDLDNIVGTPAVTLGVGTSLSLVAEGVVSVRQDGVELVLEELRDERSGEGEHEYLPLR